MPLRCSCLLALLLLPLSLCCSSKNTTQLCNDAVVVKPQLNKTKRDLEHLRNSTCKQQNYTLPSCTLDSRNISTTLGRLTCKMWKIGLDLTEELVESLRYSTSCSCKTTVQTSPQGSQHTPLRQSESQEEKINGDPETLQGSCHPEESG
ncbi:uncharacterized protein ACB058_001111 isoform 1-T1 [Synchiropus picturatus]